MYIALVVLSLWVLKVDVCRRRVFINQVTYHIIQIICGGKILKSYLKFAGKPSQLSPIIH